MALKPPSEAQLKKVERVLRKLPPRSQRAVGGGIYMRLDAAGTRRFQFRTRGGGAQPAGTYNTWGEAVAARDGREQLIEEAALLGGIETVSELRRLTITKYATDHWWKHVLNDLEPLTQVDYEAGVKLAIKVAGAYTLEQFDRAPLLVDEIKTRLKKEKTYPKDHSRYPGHFASAAADKGLKALSAICTHAQENGIIKHNPFLGVQYFHRKRGPNGKKNGHRAIKQSEILHPRTIAQVALGMRGMPAEIEARRIIPELIAFEGFRPQDICAFRHRWWRTEDGPRTHILMEDAVKDIRGHLVVGEAKTGEREPILWPAVAEQLERIYQAQGCPDLDALVVPNANGTYLDWGNFRRHWYQALYRSGISKKPTATAQGAFDPYLCRHIAAVTMTHAQRPAEVGGGTYSRYEVARHLGHTVDTLDKVYADIPDDLLGIAGLTMDEIIRRARREAWGSIPGDDDYEEILYTTKQVSKMVGISITALCARCQRGSLPATIDGGKYYISDHALVLVGLLPPRHKRDESVRRAA